MIHFEIPKNQSSILKVIGVGGGGSNAVNYMYNLGIEGVDFVVCNTDSQALDLSPVPNKIQLGPHLTQGLGAGANPEIGKQASEESMEDITKILKVNTRMAFITAGMGGGTGTGGAPIVAKICKELGILTVGIVTIPFAYEGRRRMKQAQEGIDRLREYVDTILIISNDKMRQQFGNMPFTQAFAKADNVLATAAKCITDVITSTGQVNLDFADVSTVMRNGGVAILGSAVTEGENRAQRAVEEALSSPLLNDNEIYGAKYILLNINSAPGEFEHTMDEMDAIQAYVQQQAGDDCDVIMGMGHDPNLGEGIAVTVIATGFHQNEVQNEIRTTRAASEPEKIIIQLGEPDAEDKIETANATLSSAPVEAKDPYAPTLVGAVEKTEYSFQPQFPATEAKAAEPKEVFSLEPVITPGAEVKEPAMQEAEQAAPEISPLLSFELSVREEEMAPANTSSPEPENVVKIGERILTEYEIEERRRFEEQKRALEERANRLRELSFNIRNNENLDDMDNVPAYMRQRKNLESGTNSGDTHYSGYSVGSNNENEPGQVQTLNVFLNGKKPD